MADNRNGILRRRGHSMSGYHPRAQIATLSEASEHHAQPAGTDKRERFVTQYIRDREAGLAYCTAEMEEQWEKEALALWSEGRTADE